MIQDALYSVAQLMWSTARSLCPVRTGYLQSTITFQQRGKWSFELTALASYASYVEFGTRRMAPRHFLTNAVDMHRDDMLAAVAQAVEDAIEEVFA
jgi:HK97 gp10 family phage protein